MGSVTAADVPLELHSRILTSLNLQEHIRDKHNLETQRRQLAQLSTVCRHWAYLCRPLIFACLMHDSRQKVDRLVRLLNAPSRALYPSLQQCLLTSGIDFVEFSDTWTGFWVRLMSKKLPYHGGVRDLHCVLTNTSVPPSAASPRSREGYAPRSWSTGLPRTLPPGLIRMPHLYLSALKFRCADDFLSLLEGIRHLEKVSCKRVTFAEQSIATPPTRPVRRPRNSTPYTILASGWETADEDLHLAMTALQYSPRHGAPGQRLGEETWSLVRDLFKSLMSFFWGRDDWVRLRTIPEFRGSFSTLDADFAATHSPPSHSVRVVWTADEPDPTAPPAPGPSARVHLIKATFYGQNVPVDGPYGLGFSMEGLSWTAFENAALALDVQGGVHIWVISNPQGFTVLLDMLESDGGHGRLSRLHEKGKLSLAFDFVPTGVGLSTASVTLAQLSAMPAEHFVDGCTVALGLRERFDLWQRGYDLEGQRLGDERAEAAAQVYLREMLAKNGDSSQQRGSPNT
ncbi:uncharacterized protein PHACADRAFT_262542 [Phanerochaete carnosa HHB-10118-sp]|uniref:F-box domain-containing protein n=1 Tax=Phanerochaete carnosa (strain HHB-10118-sp) TaxID=650164 RepID=K5VZN1_PHACS|nr:uncharacterized protein PHACADRAFT_262542 [Phanerochaete carnosa HHB-10118-sp]EKM52079.1 hypothetical protein PHACADRAFT_262542 [Phanerochaete carnosa HHB-10118-sp]